MLPKLSGTPLQGEKATALAGMSMAVNCMARSGKCDEANALHRKIYKLQFPTTSEADRKKVFDATNPDCKK
jgi:TolA-binding protein